MTHPASTRADVCENCRCVTACSPGTAGVVTCVRRTEANAPAVRRLAELGLRRGASIVAGQRTPGGGRVIGVAGSWLALDARTLAAVHVAEA